MLPFTTAVLVRGLGWGIYLSYTVNNITASCISSMVLASWARKTLPCDEIHFVIVDMYHCFCLCSWLQKVPPEITVRHCERSNNRPKKLQIYQSPQVYIQQARREYHVRSVKSVLQRPVMLTVVCLSKGEQVSPCHFLLMEYIYIKLKNTDM